MATITYDFVSRCEGGGHVIFDVGLDDSQPKRMVFTTDDVRAPLNQLSRDERDTLALLILKVHFAGKTRAQIVSEIQAGPIQVVV